MLERVLPIHEAGIRKFELNDDFDPTILVNFAQIVRVLPREGVSIDRYLLTGS